MFVRERVAGSHSFVWADFDGRIVARGDNGFNASVDDGLEGRGLGCRGIALYIIELQPALARHKRVEPVSRQVGRIPVLPS